jgi:dsDNA-specific endonuclease/ATPase MutS2
MDDTRMLGLAFEVKSAAAAISRQLGFDPNIAAQAKPRVRKARAAAPTAD